MNSINKCSSNILISICIPTYNRADIINNSIQSAISQSFNNYEIVVVDDGSNDNTKDIVDLFITKERDNKIQYFKSHKNEGISNARNKCIELAKGDFILWLDSDDILEPNILCEYYSILINNEIDIIYCNIESYSINNKKLNYHLFPKDYGANEHLFLGNLIFSFGIATGGTLMKKSLYKKYGLYNEKIRFGEDYDFFSRSVPNSKVHLVPNVLYKVFIHSKNSFSGPMVYKDTSYHSLVMKDIIKNYSLKEIFPQFDENKKNLHIQKYCINWEIKHAKAKALLRLAKGFFLNHDFYNCKELLKRIESKSTSTLFLLVKAYIGLGDYVLAMNILQKHFPQKNKLLTLCLELKKIEMKLREGLMISSSQQKILKDIKKKIGFYPSVFYLYKFNIKKTNDNLLKYAITSPMKFRNRNNYFFEIDFNKEEINSAINRIIEPIVFYK